MLTHIIQGYKSKKAMKEALKAGTMIYASDPSIFDPKSGTLEEVHDAKGDFTATNHPKRSWFALITRNKRTGAIMIK